MKLTGQAERDFFQSILYVGKSSSPYYIPVNKTISTSVHWIDLSDIFKYPIIINWFDSVDIYIDVEFFRKNIKDEPQYVSSVTDERNGLQPLKIQFNSREEALISAIKKACEIYNDRVSKEEGEKLS